MTPHNAVMIALRYVSWGGEFFQQMSVRVLQRSNFKLVALVKSRLRSRAPFPNPDPPHSSGARPPPPAPANELFTCPALCPVYIADNTWQPVPLPQQLSVA